MSDKKLNRLLQASDFSAGWGQNRCVEIDGSKVFVKKVPLTELEIANAYSTKNLYEIPVWYNYGVGSAGFGAFRELAAHQKTTNWVRGGEFAAFPLLHHHRILISDGHGPNMPDLKSYVAYWNGSKTIERYIMARAESKHHLVLFLEHLTPFSEWIAENPSKLNTMFRKAIKSVDFFNQHGIIHFDAHSGNWLTDGKDLFLSDYGLLLDQEFDLTSSELKFFKEHRYYDYGQVIATVSDGVVLSYFMLDANRQERVNTEIQHSPDDFYPFMYSLIREANALHEKRLMQLPTPLRSFLRQYQPIIDAKNDFFQTMRTGKKASNKYPAQKLAKLLQQLEFIA